MQNRIHLISVVMALALMQGCSYTRQPGAVEQGSTVGGTGDVGFTHEPLGSNKHLLTVTSAPGLWKQRVQSPSESIYPRTGLLQKLVPILLNSFTTQISTKQSLVVS